jgi:caffeoyl-CoA O-methyltransferase
LILNQAPEIGTFTGHSSICIARGLTEGGKLVCCDITEYWTAIADGLTIAQKR